MNILINPASKNLKVTLRTLYTNTDTVEFLFSEKLGAISFQAVEADTTLGNIFLFKTDSFWMAEALYVANDQRGKGYAKALIKSVASYSRKNNIGHIKVLVKKSNHSSLNICKTLGAKPDHDQDQKEPFEGKNWFFFDL